MSYVSKVLQPGEHVVRTARLHWISYLDAFAILIFAAVVLVGGSTVGRDRQWIIAIAAAVIATFGAYRLFRVWFRRWTTEIAVTDRRIIYKTGFISRDTKEMNLHRVETVAVEQSLLGRFLNYGTVTVRGTGAGIENVTKVADPLAIRSAITAPTA